jgi:hypothetical protein
MFSGLLENGELYHRFDERVHDGMRLGRHQWLDARSLAYMIENDVHARGKPLRDQEWERVLVILDQGQLGSCTGNAGTGALGTQRFYDAVGKEVLPAPGDGKATDRCPACNGRHAGYYTRATGFKLIATSSTDDGAPVRTGWDVVGAVAASPERCLGRRSRLTCSLTIR